MPDDIQLACPAPVAGYDKIVLAHGGGGRVMHRLIEDVFARAFASPDLDTTRDGAVLALTPPIAITTDAFTVSPLVFPGGDIGRLAVCGTVNDVAMCGARPVHLAAAFVLEEGLPVAELAAIVDSMARAAREAGVTVVTGDTKVVERGKGDGVFITTTGLGVPLGDPVGPRRVRPGDVAIASGCVGDHGVAVMAARAQLGFEVPVKSDVAPVAGAVAALFERGVDVRCLRDPTRGGLASALCEIASAAGVGVRVREDAIPVRPAVEDACELLGLDPLYVACEGRFVAFVAPGDADRAVETLRAADCTDAAAIGEAIGDHPRTVVLVNPFGGERVLDMLSGEQLPRIC